MNWIRFVSSPSAVENARTSRVFATPGTPSSSTWPRERRAMSSPVTVPSWPMTALPTSRRTRFIALAQGDVAKSVASVMGVPFRDGRAARTAPSRWRTVAS